MKTRIFSSLAIATITTLAVTAGTVAAQESTITSSMPALSYGVQPVLELAQAKVADDVIVRYVQNSGTIFALRSSEIVYLKQQGVSDAVLTAMLDQRQRLTGSTEPATSAMQITIADAASTAAAASVPATVIVQPVTPVVVYAAPATSSSVYVIPDTQTARYSGSTGGYPYGAHYYPRYGNGYGWSYCYPAVSVVHIGTSYWSGYGHSRSRHYY